MSTAPAPAVTVSFTTAEGFGSRDRITSPKPTARARPPANVVAMAAAVNTAVLRRGCGPAASGGGGGGGKKKKKGKII